MSCARTSCDLPPTQATGPRGAEPAAGLTAPPNRIRPSIAEQGGAGGPVASSSLSVCYVHRGNMFVSMTHTLGPRQSLLLTRAVGPCDVADGGGGGGEGKLTAWKGGLLASAETGSTRRHATGLSVTSSTVSRCGRAGPRIEVRGRARLWPGHPLLWASNRLTGKKMDQDRKRKQSRTGRQPASFPPVPAYFGASGRKKKKKVCCVGKGGGGAREPRAAPTWVTCTVVPTPSGSS